MRNRLLFNWATNLHPSQRLHWSWSRRYGNYVQLQPKTKLIYPDSDGQPLANNTVQFEWIVALKQNLDRLALPNTGITDITDIFVAGDLFWYPVEGRADICVAPDVLVAVGRPKGKRGSYQQWREGDIAPQVILKLFLLVIRPRRWLGNLDFSSDMGFRNIMFTTPKIMCWIFGYGGAIT